MKETPSKTTPEPDDSVSRIPMQPVMKNGVTLRKIQSAYELQIKPQKVSQHSLFPARKSNYIGHLRNQAFVNNVRLRFLREDGTVPPSKCVPKRSQSAPIFSTAALRCVDQRQAKGCPDERHVERKCKSASYARGSLSQRPDTPNSGVQNGHTFKSTGCLQTRRSISVHKFYGNLGNASRNTKDYPETNGVFFKIVGSGIKSPYTEDSPGSYFSVLSKDYKRSNVSQEHKRASGVVHKNNDVVTRERLDYDRQTGQLLQYYTGSNKIKPVFGKGSESDIRNTSSGRPPTATSLLVETPRYSPEPEVLKSPTPRPPTTNKRSEYLLQLNKKRLYGRQYVPASPFVVISRQAVLHDRKSCLVQADFGHNGGGLNKKCECSVCQSELNLNTSRLTLASPGSTKTIGVSSNMRDYWVNPSGTLGEEDFRRRIEEDFGQPEEEEEEDVARQSEDNQFTPRIDEKRFLCDPEDSTFTRRLDDDSFHRRSISPLDIAQEYTDEKNV